MKKQDRASTSFKEIIQRAVNIKAKPSLKSSIIVREANSYYPRGYCSSHNIFIKLQNQISTTKKSKPKKYKLKLSKFANKSFSILSYTNKFAKPTCQKKEIVLEKNQKWKNSSIATGNNAIEGGKKKKSNKKCYNCIKNHILIKTT